MNKAQKRIAECKDIALMGTEISEDKRLFKKHISTMVSHIESMFSTVKEDERAKLELYVRFRPDSIYDTNKKDIEKSLGEVSNKYKDYIFILFHNSSIEIMKEARGGTDFNKKFWDNVTSAIDEVFTKLVKIVPSKSIKSIDIKAGGRYFSGWWSEEEIHIEKQEELDKIFTLKDIPAKMKLDHGTVKPDLVSKALKIRSDYPNTDFDFEFVNDDGEEIFGPDGANGWFNDSRASELFKSLPAASVRVAMSIADKCESLRLTEADIKYFIKSMK